MREKEADDGGKRKDEFACGHPREAGYVFFFLSSHSQFKDNWATIVLQGPIEFLHRFKSGIFYFLWSVVFTTSFDCVCIFVCGMLTHKLLLCYLDDAFKQSYYDIVSWNRNHNIILIMLTIIIIVIHIIITFIILVCFYNTKVFW